MVRQFVGEVEREALGVAVLRGVRPDQQLVKVVNDQLVALMGGQAEDLVDPKEGPQVRLREGRGISAVKPSSHPLKWSTTSWCASWAEDLVDPWEGPQVRQRAHGVPLAAARKKSLILPPCLEGLLLVLTHFRLQILSIADKKAANFAAGAWPITSTMGPAAAGSINAQHALA